jgi:transglutaminase/protease-like cytokinesis protein 3
MAKRTIALIAILFSILTFALASNAFGAWRSVTKVGLNKANLIISEGGQETLKAIITPGNASNKMLKWKSSDANIVYVSNSGNITGKKEGTAGITVTTNDGGKTAKCTIQVVPLQKSRIAAGYRHSVFVKKDGTVWPGEKTILVSWVMGPARIEQHPFKLKV